METVATAAILSCAFLIGLWAISKSRTGPAGPVIIITPPDPVRVGIRKVLGWKLTVNEGDVQIESRPKLKGKMPARLMGEFAEITCTMRNGAAPPLGFDKLTLSFSGINNDVTIANDGADRLAWSSNPDGKWKASAGALHHWPQALSEPVDDIEFRDAEGQKFTSAHIAEITIKMKDECK